ncbi:hypothetical protein [Corallococcus macrosporus]|uniref:Uncharacterized protein n=1 Tax=Myxococcus fulvus (strain ATCC BAA-855 / HW-1) TaxID=483219 RepID=F8C7Y0_MYXFH|nr:hypothetical protein [Corallococcus macrosporus]AEI66932.1 hypothetical protein LILAB_25195 [Corallococcus macrosporus]
MARQAWAIVLNVMMKQLRPCGANYKSNERTGQQLAGCRSL